MTPVPPARHLVRAKDLADARYRDPLDVPALARAARLSPAHFSREFRRAFGQPPHQYLLTRRMERAAALLRHTDRDGRGHLPDRGAAERRIVHHELRADVRPLSHRLPGCPPAGGRARTDPDLRAARVGAPAAQQFSRRQPRAARLTSPPTVPHPDEVGLLDIGQTRARHCCRALWRHSGRGWNVTDSSSGGTPWCSAACDAAARIRSGFQICISRNHAAEMPTTASAQ